MSHQIVAAQDTRLGRRLTLIQRLGKRLTALSYATLLDDDETEIERLFNTVALHARWGDHRRRLANNTSN